MSKDKDETAINLLFEVYDAGIGNRTVDLTGYLNDIKQVLNVPDVVGRSEPLKALLERLLEENMCSVVGDELIEEALKGF